MASRMERHPRRDASGDREKQENGSEPFFHDRLSEPFTNSSVGLGDEYSLIQVTSNLHTKQNGSVMNPYRLRTWILYIPHP